MNTKKEPKSLLQNVIGMILLNIAGLMTFSTFMYIIGDNDKWFSRLALAVVSAGLGALLRRD